MADIGQTVWNYGMVVVAVAFLGKVIYAWRTGTIRMPGWNRGPEHDYRRAVEPKAFYRTVVGFGLAAVFAGCMAWVGFHHPGMVAR